MDSSWRLARGCRSVVATLLIGLGATGCDLLDVTNPQAISPEDLDRPEAAAGLANGAAATFADAYAQVIAMSELAVDGVIWVSSQTSLQRIDDGVWLATNVDIDNSYNLLSVARWTGDHAVEKLQEILADPAASAPVARSAFFSGFSLLLLADHFSQITLDGGAPLDDAEGYGLAIERFTHAIEVAQAAGEPSLAAAALGARARAHQWLGITSGSAGHDSAAVQDAQAALALDPAVQFNLDFGLPARGNLWWFRMQDGRDLGVGPAFRRVVDPVSGLPDPRVPVSDFVGMSSNGRDSVFMQLKYPSSESDVALVKWQEMKLIIAEVAWRNGDLGAAEEAINDVRRASQLPDFAAGDSQTVRDQLIHERSAVLFLEGRRWPDGRRFTTEFEDVDILPPDRWVPEAQLEQVDRKWPLPMTESTSGSGSG